MNSTNTKSLLKEFSPLYDYLEWGFECGDGWYEVIRELSNNIYVGCVERKIKMGLPDDLEFNPIHVIQVKEKYGTLRFYLSGMHDWMQGFIDIAEVRSSVTCETCGKPGELKKRAWWCTICKDCESKSNN
jgi:hypothetical protein